MGSLTSGQSFTRNIYTSKNKFIMLIEKIVLTIMRRFRFPEIAEVTSTNPEKMEVKCKLLYHTDKNGKIRETKWLKVYSPFATKDNGFAVPPRIGDMGIVVFRNGDTNSGIFWGLEFGDKSTPPETDEKLQDKDCVLKNNGSWVRIKPNSDIQFRHNDNLKLGDKNEVYIGDSYVKVTVPELDIGALFEDQIPSNNRTPWRISEGSVELGLQRRTTIYDTKNNRIYKGSWIRQEVKNGYMRIDDGWILEVLTPRDYHCPYDELKKYDPEPSTPIIGEIPISIPEPPITGTSSEPSSVTETYSTLNPTPMEPIENPSEPIVNIGDPDQSLFQIEKPLEEPPTSSETPEGYDLRMHRIIRRIYVCDPKIEVPRYAGAIGQVEIYVDHCSWDVSGSEDPFTFVPAKDWSKTPWENYFKKINFNLEIPTMSIYFQKIDDEESSITEKTIYKENVCEVITYANSITADHLVIPRKIQEGELEREYEAVRKEISNPKETDSQKGYTETPNPNEGDLHWT